MTIENMQRGNEIQQEISRLEQEIDVMVTRIFRIDRLEKEENRKITGIWKFFTNDTKLERGIGELFYSDKLNYNGAVVVLDKEETKGMIEIKKTKVSKLKGELEEL